MKATLKKATPNPEQSFNIHKDTGHGMLSPWHYHPECELLLIKRSCGTCLIGDHVGPFKHGDLFLFGPNLPHTFRHEKKYMERVDEKRGETVVILFENNTWGDAFLSLPEISPIFKLLNTSKLGLRIKGETRKKVARIADDMLNDCPSRKLINLLSALEIITATKEYDFISSNGFNPGINSVDQGRINTIFEYTFNNFHKKIALVDVAQAINMSKHSFCRYFKLKTKKTYIQFLMEVRIGHACRLLVEEEYNMAEIGYACGYNNISHFYHQFKTLTKKNPLDYRHHYLKTEENKLLI
ncbi:AraC family transcriptional regulator [Mucilaginibacter sp.]|jgi:AraC-like DNA-binding protein|uniref:AraC family transcriptional regulator n=1 Tax=Mucilaginibacter sp. TaxID=1882438 RepID=UPI00356439AB